MTQAQLTAAVRSLLAELKPTIADDYRATDDPDDNVPGMCVTIGITAAREGDDTDANGAKVDNWRVQSWDYQTGDNSFSGGAYHHENWGVDYLYRDSHCGEVAKDMVEEAFEPLEI